MSGIRYRRVSYAVVVINAATLAFGAVPFVARLAAGHLADRSNPYRDVLLLDAFLAGLLILGMILELRRSRYSIWINLGWTALLFLSETWEVLADMSHLPLAHRLLFVLLPTLASALPLAVFVFLYRSRLFGRGGVREGEPDGGTDLVSFDSSIRDHVLGKFALWLSPVLLLYPVVLYFAISRELLSEQATAGSELLLLLTAFLTVVSFALSLRARGREKIISIGFSSLGMLANLILIALITITT